MAPRVQMMDIHANMKDMKDRFENVISEVPQNYDFSRDYQSD